MTVSDGSLADTDTFRITVTLIGPAAPTGLAATAGDAQVQLSWNANGEPDLDGYNVYRSTSLPVSTAGTPLNGATLLTATIYTDSSVINNTDYYYVVTAVDDEGHESPAAPAVAATPGASSGNAVHAQRLEPVRHDGRRSGAGLAELHARAVVPAHGHGRRRLHRRRRHRERDPARDEGPLRVGRRHELLLRHRRLDGHARRRLRGHGQTPPTIPSPAPPW